MAPADVPAMNECNGLSFGGFVLDISNANKIQRETFVGPSDAKSDVWQRCLSET